MLNTKLPNVDTLNLVDNIKSLVKSAVISRVTEESIELSFRPTKMSLLSEAVIDRIATAFSEQLQKPTDVIVKFVGLEKKKRVLASLRAYAKDLKDKSFSADQGNLEMIANGLIKIAEDLSVILAMEK